jgi:drug/metabolite transporter (DMT)-like permease
MTTRQNAYIALAATSLIWGTTWVAMKLGVTTMPPLQLAAIRQLIGGGIIVLFFLLKRENMPSKKQFGQLFFLSIFTFVLANGFSTWSLKFIPSGLGALIGALYPLSVVLMEYFFYHNKNINSSAILGIFLGIGGIVLVFYENAFHVHPEGYAFGIILAVIAMLSWSYSSITIARQKVKINPYYAMGWQMLFGSIMMYVISLFSGNNIAITAIPTTSWLAIVYLVVFGSITAMVAFIYSMKHLPTSIASLYAYINPIVAMIIGSFMLDEKITLNLIVGSIITLTGVYLVNRAMKKKKVEEVLPSDVDAV